MRALLRLVLSCLMLLGCKATIPDHRFACATDSDCPPGQRCDGDRCTSERSDGGAPDAARDTSVDTGPTDTGVVDSTVLPDSAVDTGPDGPLCTIETQRLRIHGDNVIFDSDCDGANHQGSSPLLNLGINNARGLFRFTLDPAAVSAFTDDVVVAARLVLNRRAYCGSSACPAAPGALSVRPMRNDWDEGSDGMSTTQVDYAGADWCRRAGGESPMPGAPMARWPRAWTSDRRQGMEPSEPPSRTSRSTSTPRSCAPIGWSEARRLASRYRRCRPAAPSSSPRARARSRAPPTSTSTPAADEMG